jgi:GGDEF domain-containing protein
MVRLSHERVLLVGDADRQMFAAVTQAMPAAQVKCVGTVFDAIAELSQEQYTTVIAAAEPIERRPEAAVRTLRELSGESRLLLFGHPTLEPLSQKMLQFGCDDYLVTPATAGELMQVLGAPPLRIRPSPVEPETSPIQEHIHRATPWLRIPLVDLVMDSIVQTPHDSVNAIILQLNAALAPAVTLATSIAGAPAPNADGRVIVSHQLPSPVGEIATLHLLIPTDHDAASAAVFLADLGRYLAKAQVLKERHLGLQRLAITDDLTGISNGRYFRHFLTEIIKKARVMHFPVTLFLFDIDNFKRYNDQYGHGVGDEILKQTAALMRRCVRDHDLVARISGDEFAVVFWEKEGPRQPRDAKGAAMLNRPPQEPQNILDRYRRLLSTQDFPGLGPGGKGILTISGGLAVYPWDAQNAEDLMSEADKKLMFGAKRSGRNTIHLVGGEELPNPCNSPEEA